MIGLSEEPTGPRPRLSVLITTYNHEPYIGQAIEGVLAQETTFPVEVVIGEDRSTDRTREIVLAHEAQHPDRIRVSSHPENIGAQANWIRTARACRGEYVAWLDGDDYWCSPGKLQTQVELLDRSKDLVASFHAARVVDEVTGTEFLGRPRGRRPTYGRDDLSDSSLMPTSSVVFRNLMPDPFPHWFKGVPYGDWSFFALLTEHGRFGYVDEVMSVQRRHSGGIFTRNRQNPALLQRASITMQRILIRHFGPENCRPMTDALYRSYYARAHAYADLGNMKRARHFLRRCWRDRKYDRSVSALEPMKLLVHLYFPGLYRLLRRR